MHHTARAHGAERLTRKFSVPLARGGRQSRTADVAEGDARAIPGRSVLDQRKPAAAAEYIARGPLPLVATLFRIRVQRLPGFGQPRMQANKVGASGVDLRRPNGCDRQWL